MFVCSGFLEPFLQVCFSLICVSLCLYPLLCVSAWVGIRSCVYPQCVCSLRHGTSACMPSIQLGEGGVVVVGLSIFHVLLACPFPPNNSLTGGLEEEEKHKTHALRLRTLYLFIYLFFLQVCLCHRWGFPTPRVVFLESKDCFVLLLLDLRFWKKVHWRDGMWGEEREGGKKREMKGERKERQREERKGVARRRLKEEEEEAGEGLGGGGEAWTKASYQTWEEPMAALRRTSP